jgi:hypothetical protein
MLLNFGDPDLTITVAAKKAAQRFPYAVVVGAGGVLISSWR